jgi:hypothetical protein
VVRLGLQWQMRSLSNLNAFEKLNFSLMLFLAMNVILHYFLSFHSTLMADFNHLSEAKD